MKTKKSNRQVLNPTVMQNIYHKSLPQQAAPTLLLWLPLIIACVLETVWVVSPWGTVLGGFSMLACILMVGVSLVVGIVLLIQWKHPMSAVGILCCSVFLPLLLFVLFFEVLHLDLLLH